MLNGKYTSIDRILEGVYRDFGFQGELDWIDAIEWTGEILELIAAPKQYVDKVTDGDEDRGHQCPIEIVNYRGKLPCDIIYPVQVREWDSKLQMRYSSDTFHSSVKKNEEDLPDVSLTTFGTINYTSPLLAKAELLKSTVCDPDLTFTLNDEHIYTNFETGKVEMAYKAFPTDKNGMPLIPDNVKYIQAVKYYIAEKVAQKLFLQGKMPQGQFQYIQQQRDWYTGAATNAGLIPSVDEAETWKNSLVRLIPNLNQHSSSFKYSGDKPGQRNHNSY